MSFRMSVTALVAMVFIGGLMIVGCGGGSSPTKPVTPPSPPPPPPPKVASIVVNPTSASMVVGGTQRFTASARASDGSTIGGVNFTWTSSNTAVVTINATGLATAVSAGTAMIKATGNGISSAQVAVTVTEPPVTRVTVSPSSAQQLNVGDSLTFSAMARTASGAVRDDVEISWSSSDTGVVTINASGMAKAVGAGTATIRASAEGLTSSPVTITVTEPPPPPPMVASVTVSPAEASIEEGKEQQFEAMAMTSGGMAIPDAEFTWMSSDDNIATVSSMGLVTGVSTGEVMITATADEVSGSAMLIVTEPPLPPPPVVATVMVTPMEASIEEGQTRQFEAMAVTSDGTAIPDVEFAWTSSDENVATVDSNGLATGVSAGDAAITATVDDISGSAMLTVTKPPPPPPVVATVMVTPKEASIEEGQAQQFEAMAVTSDGTAIPDVEFTWMSSDDGVATVDPSGLATGVSAGEATISATVDGVSGMAMLTVIEPPPVVATVMVSPKEASIEEGQELQFVAMAVTSDGMAVPDAEFTWMSSDDGVATVDPSGLATGVSAGEATISATVDGVSGMAMLTVTEPPPVVATVMVSPKEASIEEGQELQFVAMAVTSDGMAIPDVVFAWMSSDENVATVDSNGLASGVSAGNAAITATVDGVSNLAMLTVTEPPPVVATVMVSPKEASIEEGQEQQFVAMAVTSDGMAIPDVEFTWMSSDDNIATVSSMGLATGISAGDATITATAGVVSGSAKLTVTEAPPPPPVVATVMVSPPEASIEEGQEQQFEAMAVTSDGLAIPGAEFAWTSSDENVATVDSNGLATGVSAGNAAITATVDGVSNLAKLTVTEAPPPPPVVATVMVSPPEASIEEGQEQQFVAMAVTSDGLAIPDVEFTWMSSDDNIATVSSMGLATGISAGDATITATAGVVSGSAKLTVTEAPPPPPVVATVMVSPPEASIEEGQEQQFEATALTDDGMTIPGTEFAWTSSDENVATVDSNGLASGVSAGEAAITATVDGVSDMAKLTVTEPPPVVATVMVSPPEASIEEGGTHQFEATARTMDNRLIPGISFSWSSGDPSVATVNASGLATAVSAGSTQITATADGKSDSATLMVTEPPISRSGMFSGANGYRTSGTVTLEQDSAGKLTLRFESDFRVARAPDIWVILYTSANINYSRRRPPPDGTYENLGRVTANSGTQNYEVPSHVQLDTYDYVIIHCIAFNSEVGIAELQP